MGRAVKLVLEWARNIDCSHRPRHIGIAVKSHEQGRNILPTNDWSYELDGESDSRVPDDSAQRLELQRVALHGAVIDVIIWLPAGGGVAIAEQGFPADELIAHSRPQLPGNVSQAPDARRPLLSAT